LSDRKYRHSGYQDGGIKPSGPRPSGPRPDPRPERIEGAPRGRTAGAPGPAAFKCHTCGDVQHAYGDMTSESVCRKCGADLHTCWNCRFFDTGSRWECRETIPARVSPKDKKNECASFAPRIVRDLNAGKGRVETPNDARAAFDALFKK
jgi:hypothetical protein